MEGAQSILWRQILADVRHKIHLKTDFSLGVAFLAGMTMGIFKSWDEIEVFLNKEEIKSNPLAYQKYSKYYLFAEKLTNLLKTFSKNFTI